MTKGEMDCVSWPPTSSPNIPTEDLSYFDNELRPLLCHTHYLFHSAHFLAFSLPRFHWSHGSRSFGSNYNMYKRQIRQQLNCQKSLFKEAGDHENLCFSPNSCSEKSNRNDQSTSPFSQYILKGKLATRRENRLVGNWLGYSRRSL